MYKTNKEVGFMKKEECERFIELYGGFICAGIYECNYTVLIRNSKEEFERIRKDLGLKKYKKYKGYYYVFEG